MIFSLCHAEPQRDKKICLLSGQVHKVQDRVCGACAGRRVTGKCMALAQYLGRETGKLLARRLAWQRHRWRDPWLMTYFAFDYSFSGSKWLKRYLLLKTLLTSAYLFSLQYMLLAYTLEERSIFGRQLSISGNVLLFVTYFFPFFTFMESFLWTFNFTGLSFCLKIPSSSLLK